MLNIPTPHNNANINDIAKTVIMPGDPLRAKYIAENFLDDYKIVNTVRCAYAYTGKYKGKEITVMASGMGMPSMGIYACELFKFYDVDTVIRIGSCGAYSEALNIFDTILVENSYTEGNFAFEWNENDCHVIEANKELNAIIEETAKKIGINCIKGNTLCNDCFDGYLDDIPAFINRFPKDLNIIACEMEAFALFYNAKLLNKKASCLMSVVDSKFIKNVATAEERQTGLNNMIKLALDAAIKI